MRAIRAAVQGRKAEPELQVLPPPRTPDRAAEQGPETASPMLAPRHDAKRPRVLFVEPDAATREQLETLLNRPTQPMNITFASNAREALDALAQAPVDAVVTVPTLPDRSGIEFINEIEQSFRGTARLVRGGVADREMLRGFAGWPPQFLGREIDLPEIEAALERALQLNEWMANESVRTLLPQLVKLPTMPHLYNQVASELASTSGSIEFVGKLISRDPALTAKILQLVNSPAFALARPIADAVEAVMFLGGERTKTLILAASASLELGATRCEGFSQEQMWFHAMAVGNFARAISLKETRDARLADQAFTAGLLHDVGKLLLAANIPDNYGHTLSVARAQKMPGTKAEEMAFSTTHAELGACLLGTWGLPLPILQAIAWHHTPGKSMDKSFSILTAVHAANALDHEKKKASSEMPSSQLDSDYLLRLGLSERRNRWRELCGCTPRPEDEGVAEQTRCRMAGREN